MLVMERDGAMRALRLLRDGVTLSLTARLDLETGGPYRSENVIAEIPGGARRDEIVLMGAHLDSWDLGSGTLDNGANVALMIDIARQVRRLGLTPARTIRLVLWNGEEQGMVGSWATRGRIARSSTATCSLARSTRDAGTSTGGSPADGPT